tara:strand:- start:36 stop:449 length:414 start_codon:yes stop_codon:yes gene_type:complete
MNDLWGNEIPKKMTGIDFEKHIANLLRQQGCSVTEQVCIGYKFGNHKHNIDSLVNAKILVSVKFQDVAGTAEEKVGYEMWTLNEKILTGAFEKAFVIFGGQGWTIYENLEKMVKLFPKIKLVRYEDDKTLSFIKNEI